MSKAQGQGKIRNLGVSLASRSFESPVHRRALGFMSKMHLAESDLRLPSPASEKRSKTRSCRELRVRPPVARSPSHVPPTLMDRGTTRVPQDAHFPDSLTRCSPRRSNGFREPLSSDGLGDHQAVEQPRLRASEKPPHENLILGQDEDVVYKSGAFLVENETSGSPQTNLRAGRSRKSNGPSAEACQSGTSSLDTIAILDKFVVTGEFSSSSPESFCYPILTSKRALASSELKVLLSKSRWILADTPQLQNPCLDKSGFFRGLREFSSGDVREADKLKALQITIMVTLIVALMKALEEQSYDPANVPGWQELTMATRLLSRVMWSGKGDLMTLQCCIVKVLALLYIEEHDLAYSALSETVCLCFQIKLNRQSTWTQCGPFETHMRQRIFWTIFCIDRSVAQICGMPYLVRDSEVGVELPDVVDGQPLDADGSWPLWSSDAIDMRYIRCIVKWCQLSAEVWDEMYGKGSNDLNTEEFTAITDAKLFLLQDSLPDYLKWDPEKVGTPDADLVPRHISRQASNIHLRINHLRLLLRRQSMMSFNFSESAAKTCTAIANDTVEVISQAHFSHSRQELERYSSVTYTLGAVIPVACIILRSKGRPEIGQKTVEVFEKGIVVLRDIALSLSMARNALRRLNRIISAVEQVIERMRGNALEAYIPDEPQTSGFDHPVDAGVMYQDLFDMTLDDGTFGSLIDGPDLLGFDTWI
ncbi:uncharacterized protein Z520_05274 [Fonsecaea multimorphosa CBS 102226]|uniref:Xylanolytic transcriptional activator regulatory domain-containing protein n=1 Tax=Fonsecaea multimorphosa CBS 102226 TaxID=1442371 RepID=A0A0D2KQ05_9EURO|nr:uncharacterized protein Z520_05274 [Fonsecaea multimorphosa CBS 102226]KIX98813.1 hypothetical protein Z520_05274 [Fonsecaea multimorphosa CBS 102226]